MTVYTLLDLIANMPIVLQAEGGGGGDMFLLLLMVGVTFFIVYTFMIAPERKRRKQTQNMLDSLKKNDRVMTNGGIVGWVQRVKENEVVLKVDEKTGATITVVRHAIAHVLDVSSGGGRATDEDGADRDETPTDTSAGADESRSHQGGGKGKGKKGRR